MRSRQIDEPEAERIVLGHLRDAVNDCATASQIDSHMLQVGDECMALRDVQNALTRCERLGEVERLASPLSLYRITQKGRDRLATSRA